MRRKGKGKEREGEERAGKRRWAEVRTKKRSGSGDKKKGIGVPSLRPAPGWHCMLLVRERAL